MGLFDDVVPPDTAFAGYRPLSITVRPSLQTGAARSPQDESVEPPPGLGNAQTSADASDGTDRPALARTGLFDDIVPPAREPHTVSFGVNDAIVESPTNPPRVYGSPEHLVPLAPASPTNMSFSRAASVALDAMMNGARALTGSAGVTGAPPPRPPTLRELKRPELRVPLATPPEGWPENPVMAPPGTPAIPAAPAAESPGFGATVGEAVWRGGKEGLQDTADAFRAWHEKKTEDDDSYVGNLLQTPITKGYRSADWWGAQIGHGLAKSSPTFAAALGLGFAGTAVAGPVGGVVGGIVGFGLGSAIQEIAPAYQRARTDGLSHEEAVNRAWLQSGIAGAFGAAMGAVGGPAGKAAEATIKQKIGQALADIFVKAPLIGAAHQGVSAKVEGKDLSLIDLGQGYVLNAATGAIMVGGHKLIRAADGTMRGFGADELGTRPGARRDSDSSGSSTDGSNSPEIITDFVRRADVIKPPSGPAPARLRTAREELVDSAVDAGMTREQAEVAYSRMSPSEIERELGEIRAGQAARAKRDQEKAGRDAAAPHDGEARAPAVSRSEAEGGKSASGDAEARSTAATRTAAEERAPEQHQVDSESAPGFAPSQMRKLLRAEEEQIVQMWREVRKPLLANASAHRKDVIRGYRRELSRIGVLSAKTEAEARNRLVDRQGERPKAIDSEIIEGTGAAPPGAPSPSATRTADLTAPRPEGGVFDSKRANDRTPVDDNTARAGQLAQRNQIVAQPSARPPDKPAVQSVRMNSEARESGPFLLEGPAFQNQAHAGGRHAAHTRNDRPPSIVPPASVSWEERRKLLFGQTDLFGSPGTGREAVPPLPKFTRGGPTAGVLQTDATADRQLVSGLGGPASLVPRGSLGFDIVTRTHVEGHAAALMRQLGIRRGTVYINNPAICSSCERLLPLMLPAGATLSVVLPSGAVVIFVGTAP